MHLRRTAISLAVLLCASVSSAQQPSVVDLASLVQEGKYREAQMLANTMIVDGAADDAVYYYLGVCRVNTGEMQAAEEPFLRAYRSDTANVWYCGALLTYYTATSRYPELCEYYERARELDPGSYTTPEYLCRYADALKACHRAGEAESCYREAFGLDPDCIEALLGLCEIKLAAQDYASFFAISDYLVRRPDIPAPMKGEYVENIFRFVNADVYKWWHESIDSLVVRCVNQAPRDSTCVSMAAGWFYSTGRTERGIGYFEALAAICPDSSGPRMNLVAIKINARDYRGAIAACDTILRAGYPDVDRSQILGTCADCYERLGDEKTAFRYYSKALKEDPDNDVVLNNWAYRLCLEGRRLQKAERMSARALELNPDKPTYLDTYGWILHRRGRDEEARKVFKRAMAYGGKDEYEILVHYSEVLEALGEKDLAAYFRTLAERKGKK